MTSKQRTSISYFFLASLLSRNIGMHGRNNPKRQQMQPLLSKSLAFLQIKHGSQQTPQAPKMNRKLHCKNSTKPLN